MFYFWPPKSSLSESQSFAGCLVVGLEIELKRPKIDFEKQDVVTTFFELERSYLVRTAH